MYCLSLVRCTRVDRRQQFGLVRVDLTQSMSPASEKGAARELFADICQVQYTEISRLIRQMLGRPSRFGRLYNHWCPCLMEINTRPPLYPMIAAMRRMSDLVRNQD